jgi:hypothetical protein
MAKAVLYSELNKGRSRAVGWSLIAVAVGCFAALVLFGSKLKDPIPVLLLIAAMFLPIIGVVFISTARYNAIRLTPDQLSVGTQRLAVTDLTLPVLAKNELPIDVVANIANPFGRRGATEGIQLGAKRGFHGPMAGQSMVGVRDRLGQLWIITTFHEAKLIEALTGAIAVTPGAWNR